MEDKYLRLVCGVYSIKDDAKILVNRSIDVLLRYQIFLTASVSILTQRKTVHRVNIENNPAIHVLKRDWDININHLDKGLFIFMNLRDNSIGYCFYCRPELDYTDDDVVNHYVTMLKELTVQYKYQIRHEGLTSPHPLLTMMMDMAKIEVSTEKN